MIIFYEPFADKVKRVIAVDLWFNYVMLPRARGIRCWLYILRELLRCYEEVTLTYARYIFGYWEDLLFDMRMRRGK